MYKASPSQMLTPESYACRTRCEYAKRFAFYLLKECGPWRLSLVKSDFDASAHGFELCALCSTHLDTFKIVCQPSFSRVWEIHPILVDGLVQISIHILVFNVETRAWVEACDIDLVDVLARRCSTVHLSQWPTESSWICFRPGCNVVVLQFGDVFCKYIFPDSRRTATKCTLLADVATAFCHSIADLFRQLP